MKTRNIVVEKEKYAMHARKASSTGIDWSHVWSVSRRNRSRPPREHEEKEEKLDEP